MKVCERGNSGAGWHGIWRASVPASIRFGYSRSSKRRSGPNPAQTGSRRRKPPAPFITALFAFLLFVQASALPAHIGLMFVAPGTAAMTHGCEKGTCCTPLCFLDKHGGHHCVHMSGDSCDCALSTNDCTCNPIFLSAIIDAWDVEPFFTNPNSTRMTLPAQALLFEYEPGIPVPPPK